MTLLILMLLPAWMWFVLVVFDRRRMRVILLTPMTLPPYLLARGLAWIFTVIGDAIEKGVNWFWSLRIKGAKP